MSGNDPATRLERALELYLAALDAGSDPAALLSSHPELRDFLEPMLAGTAAGSGAAGSIDAAPGDDGQTLGEYRLLRELGRGGMGVVYEALQDALDRRVALKVIAPGLVASPAAIARFRREAAAAGRLRHPGIVEVYDFGRADGQHWFAMQLIDGTPLHACKERFRTVPAATALAQQVLAALQHAHDNGLVHRDVKPANILVRSDDTAVLTDFGLASDEDLPSLTQAGAFLGTLDYASPEQVRGEAVDARADVFAVGVILHELLAGAHPFRAATAESTMQRVLLHEPPPLHDVQTRIPRDLAAIVACALAKNRARRYASAAAMLADLDRLRSGAPVSVRLPSPAERLVRWAKREPWRATSAMLLGLGALSLAGAVGFYVANAPAMAAGERSIAEQQRDDILTTGWALYGDDPAGAMRHLDAHPGLGGEEAAILRAMALLLLDRREEAAAAIGPWNTPATRRLAVAYSLAPPNEVGGEVGNDAGSADATDPLAAFVDGMIAYRRAMDAESAPAGYHEATVLLHRAALLASSPRSTYLSLLLRSAARGRDASTFALARAALERHFPGLSVTRVAVATSLVHIDPAAGCELLEPLCRDFPDVAEYHYTLAQGQRSIGRTGDAETSYRRCLEVDPGHAPAWNNLGMLLRAAGRTDEAIAAYRNAVRVAPGHARAWYNLGNVLLGRDPAGAEAAYRRAVDERPGYAKAMDGLGRSLLARNDPAAAVAEFERAVEADPELAGSWSNLSVAHLRLDQFAEALPAAERACKLSPADARHLGNLVQAAVRCGRTDVARSSSKLLVELDPDSARAWSERVFALLLEPAPDVAAAVTAAERAVDFAPDDAHVRLAAACAAFAASRLDDARNHIGALDELGRRLPAWETKQLDDLRRRLSR